ncbi:MAG: nucleotide exchange factor GrpE [Cytophagales bacterium]
METEKEIDMTEKETNEQEVNDAQMEETAVESEASNPEETGDELVLKLKAELEEQKDKYLRLYSEFDNFRKRTAKEKIELMQTAGKDLMLALLPVIDDLERAQKSIENATEVKAVSEGLELVFNKFLKTLESKGLKSIEALGQTFDSDVHEAITQIPAPSEDMKGKVVDVLEKGYQMHDKIIRFSKVVIGS